MKILAITALSCALVACGGGASGSPGSVVPVAKATPAAITEAAMCLEPQSSFTYPEVSFSVVPMGEGQQAIPMRAISTDTSVAIVKFSGTSGGMFGVAVGSANIEVIDATTNAVLYIYPVTVKPLGQC